MQNNSVKIYFSEIKIAKIANCFFDVTLDDLLHFQKIKNHKRKLQFLFGRSLLRRALKLYGIKQESVINLRGKPSIALLAKGIRFNLSHSHNLVALVVSFDCRVGIDIQKIKKINRPKKLLNKITNNSFNDQKPDPQNHYLIKQWVMKESVVKAMGEGIHFGLKNIDVNDNSSQALANRAHDSSPKKAWYLHHFRPCFEYYGCVATEMPNLDVTYCYL